MPLQLTEEQMAATEKEATRTLELLQKKVVERESPIVNTLIRQDLR